MRGCFLLETVLVPRTLSYNNIITLHYIAMLLAAVLLTSLYRERVKNRERVKTRPQFDYLKDYVCFFF